MIIDGKGWYSEFDEYMKTYKKNDVVVYDHVGEEDLLACLANAYGFISASLYEGFGFPGARYCGCPRIFCSDIFVYLEIGLEGVVYFNLYDKQEMVNIIFQRKCRETSHLRK